MTAADDKVREYEKSAEFADRFDPMEALAKADEAIAALEADLAAMTELNESHRAVGALLVGFCFVVLHSPDRVVAIAQPLVCSAEIATGSLWSGRSICRWASPATRACWWGSWWW